MAQTTRIPKATAAGTPRPAVARLWLGVGGAVVLLALATALVYSGSAAPRQLADPGIFTRWALPIFKAVHNLSMATVIGAMVFAVGILPRQLSWKRGSKNDDGVEHPAFTAAMNLAAGAAVLWTLAALAVMVLTYSDVAGIPLSGDASFSEGLLAFLTDFDTGRAWLTQSIIAAVVATLAFGVRNLTGLALTTALAFGGVIPMSLIGHSAGGDDHYGAVNSIALHLLGVTVWVGGIIVLAVISGKLAPGAAQTAPAAHQGTIAQVSGRDITADVLKRFSTLAGLAFALVFFSGVVNASIRMEDLSQLGTRWGSLVAVKAAGTLLLGIMGFLHRQWIIPQLGLKKTARRVLWQLITVELLIMGAVSGVAVALARTAPPAPEELQPDATPARILTGYELPPELTPQRWLSEWRWDWLWVAFALVVGITYVLGAVKLGRRGDRWPLLRTASWLVGLVALTYVTSGAPSVYGMVLFSAHMVGHMALTMMVPLFLVLGSPVTLALKALPPRADGTRGIREWILVAVHSRFSRLVTHPLFAAANFAGSIILFYYSPLFGLALEYHVGHELMNLHFLITGYLFILSMIGSDPVPWRAPYPLRLLLLFATMAFHAFFGVALMGSPSLLQASWFGNMGRDWGPSAIVDQQLGGAVTWGIGEIPTLAVALGVAVMWSRSDDRERKRRDRAADRTGEAELNAYNDMFSRLNDSDRARR